MAKVFLGHEAMAGVQGGLSHRRLTREDEVFIAGRSVPSEHHRERGVPESRADKCP
jgi:hypothetical protein